MNGASITRSREIYPATTDTGRTTTGISEFNMKLDHENLGVMLRRKLDYQFPNQRAEVFVADATGPTGLEAGGHVVSGRIEYMRLFQSEGELGATQHVVQTSNRRFRDESS